MTPLDQYLALITPVAVVTAVIGGAALGMVALRLRPSLDRHLMVFLAVLLGVLWYGSQVAATVASGIQPWGTLGRLTLYTFGFCGGLWASLRVSR